MNRVLLSDGRPAYERAPERMRQSHIDLDRQLRARRNTLVQEVRELDRQRRELGEPGAAGGTLIVASGISALFVLTVFAFAIFH